MENSFDICIYQKHLVLLSYNQWGNMKTNKILDLATVYNTFTLNQIIAIVAEIKEAKEALEIVLVMMKADTTDMEERLFHILSVEEQIDLANKNLRVLENAILCHESKIFERRTIQDKTVVICLN